MDKKKVIFFTLSFFLFLAWGVYTTGWYETTHLKVNGVAEGGEADLAFLWDSGEGLNNYEDREVLVNVLRKVGEDKQHIRIKALQEKHPHSTGTNVSVIRIIIDGKEFDLRSVKPRSIFNDILAIHLTPEDPVYEFYAEVQQHIQIVFAKSGYFGKVAVEIDGTSSTHDLYASSGRYDKKPYDYFLLQPDRSFQIDLELPRYRIKSLLLRNKEPENPVSFSEVLLCHENDCNVLSFDPNSSVSELLFHEPNQSLKRFFDPARFCFRVIFALGNVWLLSLLAAVIRREGAFPLFFHRDRRFFWSCALIFGTVNFMILVPFWPGIMSQDSLAIWRASGLPGVYINSHPILNQLFYFYLRGIWNNPAIVPLTQIIATSLLVAYTFEKIRKEGVSLRFLVPLFLVLLCSLPVHLYNVALWKDIPFALLVVTWGLFFVLGEQKVSRLHRSVSFWGLLLLSYIGIGFFRHNGLVYLLIIPLFWVLTSRFDWKKGAMYSLMAIVLATSLLWSMKNLKAIGGLDFLSDALVRHTMFLKNSDIPREMLRVGKGYFQVFDMEKEGTVSDKWHYYLNDRYSWDYLRVSGLSDYYGYVDRKPYFPKLRKKILKIYQASYEKPWKYLIWNPLHMLILVPLVFLGLRLFPSAAIYSGFLLCGVIPILAIDIFNWRYYYFFYFGLYFILPLMLLDLQKRKRRNY